MLSWLLVIGLFAIAGYYDLKERKIPDLVISLTWIALILPIYGFPFNLQVDYLGAGFAVFYFLNTLTLMFSKLPVYGWGDVLLYAPFWAFCSCLGQIYVFEGVVILGLILGFFMKKGCPMAVLFFLGAATAALL